MPMWAELGSVGVGFFLYQYVFNSLFPPGIVLDVRRGLDFLMNFEDLFHQWRHLFVTR